MKQLKKFFKKEEVYYALMYLVVLLFLGTFTYQVWFNSDPEMNDIRWGIRIIFLTGTLFLLYQGKYVIKDLRSVFPKKKELTKEYKIKLIDKMIDDLECRKKNNSNDSYYLCHYVLFDLIDKKLVSKYSSDLTRSVKKIFPEMYKAFKKESKLYPHKRTVVWKLEEFNYDFHCYYQAKIKFLKELKKKLKRTLR